MSILPENQGGTGQSTYVDNQLLVGTSSTNGLRKATLTAGTNISIVTSISSVTISATGAAGTPSLTINDIVLGGGAGQPLVAAANWSVVSNVLIGNNNVSPVSVGTVSAVIVHLSNLDNSATRVLIDTFNGNPAITQRRAGGTAATPTFLSANQNFSTYDGRGYGTTGYFGPSAVMAYVSTENWTDTAQGSQIQFYTTATGASAAGGGVITAILQPSGCILQGPLQTGVNQVFSIPSAIVNSPGVSLVTQGLAGTPNAIAQISYGAAGQFENFRAEGTATTPLATSANFNIASLIAAGYDGANWITATNMGVFSLRSQNQTATTDHSTYAALSLTPTTSTTIQVVAQWFPGVNGGVSFQGDATGGSALAGWVGEEGSQIVPIASGTALASSNLSYAVSSTSLGAGDWEVSGETWFNSGSHTGILFAVTALNSVSNTIPSIPSDTTARTSTTWDGQNPGNLVLPLSPIRQLNPTPTTVYLVAQAVFTSGTITAFGRLHWRRVR